MHGLEHPLTDHFSLLPSPAIKVPSMCLGLSPRNKVVFASLLFHIKDKGLSLIVLVTETWEVGQVCTWEVSPSFPLPVHITDILDKTH